MPKARTDPTVEAEVLRLRDEGMSLGAIEKATGVNKSTVRKIIGRAESKDTLPSKKTPARAREIEKAVFDRKDTVSEPKDTPDDPMAMLTRERSAKELMIFIATAKRGYKKASESKQEPDKKTWQEIQYLKLYKDGIKILVDCTGLSREAILAEPSNPVDDYLEKTLAELRDEL